MGIGFVHTSLLEMGRSPHARCQSSSLYQNLLQLEWSRSAEFEWLAFRLSFLSARVAHRKQARLVMVSKEPVHSWKAFDPLGETLKNKRIRICIPCASKFWVMIFLLWILILVFWNCYSKVELTTLQYARCIAWEWNDQTKTICFEPMWIRVYAWCVWWRLHFT